MKRGNCDNHVVEQVNVSKFSKLDDRGTSLRLFESFFNDALVDMIIGCTKLYSHREKADTSFEITDEIFCLFLEMLLLKGGHKLPNHEMYWELSNVYAP